MKFDILSLAAVASAVAPRDPPPLNSNPVQTGGETTPSQSLTILPIVSVTDLPTTTSSDKITLPILTSPSTHTTHTMPPTSESSPVPTSLPTNSNGSTYSSSSLNSTSSGITTRSSTTSSGTAPTGSITSGSGTSGSQTTGSPTSSGTGSSSSTAAAAIATANVLAGIAALAGLVIAA